MANRKDKPNNQPSRGKNSPPAGFSESHERPANERGTTTRSDAGISSGLGSGSPTAPTTPTAPAGGSEPANEPPGLTHGQRTEVTLLIWKYLLATVVGLILTAFGFMTWLIGTYVENKVK